MAEFLSEQSGISIEHYKFSIDVYAIKHILKNHGIPAVEIPKGQIAITDKDFELIQDVLENPDLVFYDGKNELGEDVFNFRE